MTSLITVARKSILGTNRRKTCKLCKVQERGFKKSSLRRLVPEVENFYEQETIVKRSYSYKQPKARNIRQEHPLRDSQTPAHFRVSML